MNFDMNWGMPSPNMIPDMNAINGVDNNSLNQMLKNKAITPESSGFLDGIPTWGEGGLVSSGLGLGQSLLGGWMGMKQLDFAKDRLRENKRQFNMNWDANKRLTNARLRDRQEARLATGGNYQSVDEYMKQNGVR